MRNGNEITGYSALQIWLHWIIAIIVAFQFLAHDGISNAWRAYARGQEASASDALMANLHLAAGLVALVIAVWRFSLRFLRGVPRLPHDRHPILHYLACAVHFLLYALLMLLPVSGLIAWLAGVEEAAETHELLTTALLALVGVHVLGALVQQFVFKNPVLQRITRPQRTA